MRGFMGDFLFILIFSGILLSQQAPADADQDSVSVNPVTEDGELVLDEIDIQGHIEKPGVIVLPRRVDPEMGEIELDRSFDNEVKSDVETLPEAEEALGEVEGIQSIKKAVERQRN